MFCVMGYVITTLDAERMTGLAGRLLKKEDSYPLLQELNSYRETNKHPHPTPYIPYAPQIKQIMQNTCKTNTEINDAVYALIEKPHP